MEASIIYGTGDSVEELGTHWIAESDWSFDTFVFRKPDPQSIFRIIDKKLHSRRELRSRGSTWRDALFASHYANYLQGMVNTSWLRREVACSTKQNRRLWDDIKKRRGEMAGEMNASLVLQGDLTHAKRHLAPMEYWAMDEKSSEPPDQVQHRDRELAAYWG